MEAKRKYQALTAAGKTDEAKADLARLAIIRQQREEAAKKREMELKGRSVYMAKSVIISFTAVISKKIPASNRATCMLWLYFQSLF